MNESLIIEKEMQRQFHQLAKETHRTESEIIHEALAGYLAADHHYVEVLKQRIAAADRGEFASENEMKAFFAERSE
ncbi:MAG: hypothetical protein WAW75_09950 [Gallionella sp.]